METITIIFLTSTILVSIVLYLVLKNQRKALNQNKLDYRLLLLEKNKIITDHQLELQELSDLAESKLEKTITTYEERLTQAENIIANYEKTFIAVDSNIRLSELKIKEIDAKGTFQADDEIGWFFAGIKQIQENLNKFKIENK